MIPGLPTLPGHETPIAQGDGKPLAAVWYRYLKLFDRIWRAPPAVQKSGLPAAGDLAAGTWGVFKDTSGGGVYVAYNDAGAIKKAQLT